jgi:hypothetical protein
VFPVRYELNFYISIRRNSVFKVLICSEYVSSMEETGNVYRNMYRASLGSGKILDLYSGGTCFESRPGHRICMYVCMYVCIRDVP